MPAKWRAGLAGACVLTLAVPVGTATVVTQIKNFDAGQIRDCEVPAIGAEFLAEELDDGEVDIAGEPAAEGPITSARNTFTADAWELEDGPGTVSVTVVVGKFYDRYFETDETSKYQVWWYAASGTMQYQGQTYSMDGRAARFGAPMALAIIGGDPSRFAPFAQQYRRALQEFGRDSRPLSIHSPGHVADTDDQAIDEFWPHYQVMLGRISRSEAGRRAPMSNSWRRSGTGRCTSARRKRSRTGSPAPSRCSRRSGST